LSSIIPRITLQIIRSH